MFVGPATAGVNALAVAFEIQPVDDKRVSVTRVGPRMTSASALAEAVTVPEEPTAAGVTRMERLPSTTVNVTLVQLPAAICAAVQTSADAGAASAVPAAMAAAATASTRGLRMRGLLGAQEGGQCLRISASVHG